MAGHDDNFSWGTTTIDDIQHFEHVRNSSGLALGDEQLGLRNGWKSERVSRSEIQERLSALAASDPDRRPAIAEHAERRSPQSTTAIPPGVRAVLEDSIAVNSSTLGLKNIGVRDVLFPSNKTEQKLNRSNLSWDIEEAEKLLATAPTAQTEHPHPQRDSQPAENTRDQDALSFEAKRHALGSTGQQIVHDDNAALSWQFEDEHTKKRLTRRGGPLPEVVMPRCAAAEAKLFSQAAHDMGAEAPIVKAVAARRSRGEVLSHSEIRQRLGNLTGGAFPPLDLSQLKPSEPPPEQRAPRGGGALGPLNKSTPRPHTPNDKGRLDAQPLAGAFGPLAKQPATHAHPPHSPHAGGQKGVAGVRKTVGNGGGVFAPLVKPLPASSSSSSPREHSTAASAHGVFLPFARVGSPRYEDHARAEAPGAFGW